MLYQRRNAEDHRAAIDQDLEHLHVALDRAHMGIGAAAVELLDVIESLADRHGHAQHDAGLGDVLDQQPNRLGQVWHQLDAVGNDQQRGHRGEARCGLVGGLRAGIQEWRGQPQNYLLEKEIDQQRHQRQQGETDSRLCPSRLRFEKSECLFHGACA